MPRNVARVEQLMYVSVGLGILLAALRYDEAVAHAGMAFVLIVQGCVFGLFVFVIWLTARRHANWARWVLLVLFLGGLIVYIPDLARVLRVNPLAAALSVLQYFLQGAALYLVFTGDAKVWFERPK